MPSNSADDELNRLRELLTGISKRLQSIKNGKSQGHATFENESAALFHLIAECAYERDGEQINQLIDILIDRTRVALFNVNQNEVKVHYNPTQRFEGYLRPEELTIPLSCIYLIKSGSAVVYRSESLDLEGKEPIILE